MTTTTMLLMMMLMMMMMILTTGTTPFCTRCELATSAPSSWLVASCWSSGPSVSSWPCQSSSDRYGPRFHHAVSPLLWLANGVRRIRSLVALLFVCCLVIGQWCQDSFHPCRTVRSLGLFIYIYFFKCRVLWLVSGAMISPNLVGWMRLLAALCFVSRVVIGQWNQDSLRLFGADTFICCFTIFYVVCCDWPVKSKTPPRIWWILYLAFFIFCCVLSLVSGVKLPPTLCWVDAFIGCVTFYRVLWLVGGFVIDPPILTGWKRSNVAFFSFFSFLSMFYCDWLVDSL